MLLGDGFAERDEAFRESLLAFVGPILPLIVIGFLLVRWITRTALGPLDDLRAQFAARDQILEVEQVIRRMTRLVERLLQLGRAEAGPDPAGTSCDAGEILDLLVRERAEQASGRQLEVMLPEESPRAALSGDDLAIMVSNMLDNTLRHAPPGGRIAVVLGAEGCCRSPIRAR